MSAVGEPSRSASTDAPSAGARSSPPALDGALRRSPLAKRIEQGDLAAKHEMTERNLGLVYVLAKRYRNCGAAFDDLIQEGTLGLMRAVEGFDHRRGVKFSTYAAWWIRSSLLDAVGAEQSIRIPAHAAQQLAAVRRAEQELEGAGVRLASTADALAERSGLSASSVQALRTAATRHGVAGRAGGRRGQAAQRSDRRPAWSRTRRRRRPRGGAQGGVAAAAAATRAPPPRADPALRHRWRPTADPPRHRRTARREGGAELASSSARPCTACASCRPRGATWHNLD